MQISARFWILKRRRKKTSNKINIRSFHISHMCALCKCAYHLAHATIDAIFIATTLLSLLNFCTTQRPTHAFIFFYILYFFIYFFFLLILIIIRLRFFVVAIAFAAVAAVIVLIYLHSFGIRKLLCGCTDWVYEIEKRIWYIAIYCIHIVHCTRNWTLFVHFDSIVHLLYNTCHIFKFNIIKQIWNAIAFDAS